MVTTKIEIQLSLATYEEFEIIAQRLNCPPVN